MNLDTLLSQLEELIKDLRASRKGDNADLIGMGRGVQRWADAQELENIVRVARARKD